MNECVPGKENDLLASRWAASLLWWGPAVLVVATGSIGLDSVGTGSTGNIIHTATWAIAFMVGAAGCLANARRCGRLHCFFTGPLYLLAAFASVLYGMGILPLGHQGWNWILGTAVVGTLFAIYGLERVFGKYKASRAPKA